MKHVVNLVVSQPDHEFISMRSRRHEKTCIQEANSPEEAMNRATRRMRSLGFYVHGASIVEQKVEVSEVKPLTEGVAETETAISAAQDKRKTAMKKATAEVDKSEVQDKAGKAQAGSALATYLKKKADTMKEEVEVTSEYLEEKLTAADPASKWIEDFVKSDNPKFEGKSKKERINMALGAKYAADRAVKEDVELEEGRAMDYKMSRSSVAGDRGDSKGGEINVSQKDREEIARILGAKDDKKQDKKLEEGALLYYGEVNKKPYELTIPSSKDLGDYSSAALHKKLSNENPHLQHHEVTAIVDSGGEEDSDVEVKHKGKKYTHHVYNRQEPSYLDEQVELEEGVKNDPNFPRVHTSWFVKPAKGKRQFGKEFRMADKDKAEAHAMEIGGSVHKMDQYGSTMKEEVEQIDELNKETLASYIGKAAHSVGTKERIAKGLGQNAATTTSKKKREMYLNSAKTWRDAAARRVAGIKTAAGKLAKEEVEQVEEAKADPVAKAKELLDQAEKGTYKGSAKALQAALEKAKSRNFDQGKGYKLEEDAEKLEETGPVKRRNKTVKNFMAASKGAKINAAMGDAKMDPADYGYNSPQHLNKAIGRMVSRGAQFAEETLERTIPKSNPSKFQLPGYPTPKPKEKGSMDLVRPSPKPSDKGPAYMEEAEGTTPTTPKEKELAAKAGDPNKITKKDVLAARGVKLDEVKGSFKDQATEKAEDKRLAKKEAKDSKSAKTAETLINLAKSKKNKVNVSPTMDQG